MISKRIYLLSFPSLMDGVDFDAVAIMELSVEAENMGKGAVDSQDVLPNKKCNATMGRCSADCDEDCCEGKCLQHYHGTGYCDGSLGPASTLCQCSYDC
ncbi:unnamed protein product [Dovyalis caffra]|uniref:Defensin-like protein n=1 Tax=Dovyalis caffra TaxID=77055 RepID=A0AAV1S6V6_9ROSI|nr:unnamed protein product [Dovyalis caffra]